MTDEFAFIRSIIPKTTYQQSLIQGIGDDAALFLNDERYETVVAVDTLVEGVHFKKSTLSSFDLGYKALAVNLSDLAAMGALPLYYLVSIAIPRTRWSEIELSDLFKGMNELAKTFQVDLIGGDTVSTSSALVVSVTAIGKVERNRHLLRSQARPGDFIFVTGSVGGSSAGLSLLLEKSKDYPYCEQEMLLIEQHQRPKPQIYAGRIFAELNCRVALNDISDGIASEAYEIAEASKKKLVLDYEKIPKHPALQLFSRYEIEHFVLYGGEDFQLIGCLSQSNWDHVKTMFEEANIPITLIGHVEAGEADVQIMKNGVMEKVDKRGYNHFKENK